MKKILAIGVVMAVALALVLSFTLPAMATETTTGTGVTVNQGTSDPPIVKAKWEQDLTVDLEDGDPTHMYYRGASAGCPDCGCSTDCNAQFLPPLVADTEKTVQYWAIVADPDGPTDIANVYVDVYHPDLACSPGTNLPDGTHKYQLRMIWQDKGLEYGPDNEVIGYTPGLGVDKFLTALEANLVTLNTAEIAGIPDNADYATGDPVLNEILYELDKCDAHIYMAEGPLHYHQPCGDYKVEVRAVDTTSSWSNPLVNCMTYICVQAFRIDITSLTWGNVNLCTTKWLWGDNIFEAPDASPPNKATVHNIGNMPLQIAIAQTDMGMGITGLPPATQLADPSETVVEQGTNWNVYFDARIGQNPINAMYFDPYDPDTMEPFFVTLPTILMPCQPQELDLSIHVIKADTGVPYTGTMLLECVESEWPCGPPDMELCTGP
jgi:hypothetical protein